MHDEVKSKPAVCQYESYVYDAQSQYRWRKILEGPASSTPRRGIRPWCNSTRPVPQSFAMTLRHARRALAIATIAMFVVAVAHAQDVTLPNPDSSYGTTPDQFLTPSDLTIPTVDDAPSPDVVTIPIPGGGEITVDGPDAPSETPLPNLPGSQWGVTQQTPYSHDIGPTLP
jgi:hypothetical protein